MKTLIYLSKFYLLKSIYIKNLLLIIFTFISINSHAQINKSEKRIYLFDVTASMEGKGVIPTANVFSSVKRNLQYSIGLIKNKNSEITIIPFTNKPLDKYSFPLDSLQSINQCIDNLKIEKGDTNIADAWLAGINEIDTTKVNYLFLITDGLHNTGPEKNILYEHIDNWGNIANDHYYFAFYIMLTPNAKELELVEKIRESKQIWPVESLDMNVVFIQSEKEITTNINNNNTIVLQQNSSIEYDLNNIEYTLRLEDNPYYSIDNITRLDLTNNYISFDINEKIPRLQIPIEYPIKLSIDYDAEKHPLVFFTPNTINLKIINKGVRKMTIKEIK